MKKLSPTLFFIIILFLIWILLYKKNLSNYPFGGDSSGITSAMTSWGIAHPPGYPVLMLIGNITVRLFPFFNVYEKVSLISAFFTFSTSLTIFLILKLLIRSLIVSFLVSFFYLTLFPVWLYGLVPEVFALANFLITSQIYFILKISLNKQGKNIQFYLYLFAFLIGLSFAHHHLFIFFLPSYFYLFQKKDYLKLILKEKKIKFFLFVLFGFSFYIYAPIVSYLGTTLDIENAKSLNGFFRLITRASYGTFKAYVGSGGDFINRIFDTFSLLIFIMHDFKPLGIIFIILGIIYYLIINQKILLNFFLITIGSLTFFFFYSNFVLKGSFGLATYERFLNFFYIPLIILFANGFFFLSNFIIFQLKKFTNKKIINFFAKSIIFILFFYLLINNITKNHAILKNIKNNKDFYNLGMDILNSLPKEAILLPQTDHVYFLTQNLQIIYKFKNDILIMPLIIERDYIQKQIKKKNPKIIFQKENNLKNFIQENYKKGLQFFSDRPMNFGFWIPYGILWKYYPKLQDYNLEKEQIFKINKNIWKTYSIPRINRDKKNILYLNEVKEHYARQYSAYINFLAVNNYPLMARQIADFNFDYFSDNSKFLISYLNIKISLSECDHKSKLTVKQLEPYEFDNYIDFIPVLNYFRICDKNNQKYKEIYEKYNRAKEAANIPLEQL